MYDAPIYFSDKNHLNIELPIVLVSHSREHQVNFAIITKLHRVLFWLSFKNNDSIRYKFWTNK